MVDHVPVRLEGETVVTSDEVYVLKRGSGSHDEVDFGVAFSDVAEAMAAVDKLNAGEFRGYFAEPMKLDPTAAELKAAVGV